MQLGYLYSWCDI